MVLFLKCLITLSVTLTYCTVTLLTYKSRFLSSCSPSRPLSEEVPFRAGVLMQLLSVHRFLKPSGEGHVDFIPHRPLSILLLACPDLLRVEIFTSAHLVGRKFDLKSALSGTGSYEVCHVSFCKTAGRAPASQSHLGQEFILVFRLLAGAR